MKEIFKLEAKKSIFTKKLFFMLIVFLSLKIAYTSIFQASDNYNFDKVIYKEYMEILEGPHTEEKCKYIQEEIEKQNQLIEKEDEYSAKYRIGDIGTDEYRNIKSQIEKASKRLEVLEVINNKANYFENSYNKGEYFYDLDIKNYFENISIDLFALVFAIYIIAVIFLSDYVAKTNVLVSTSTLGREKLVHVRLTLSIICIMVVSIAFQATEYITKFVTGDFTHLDAPVKSIEVMAMCIKDMTIKEFLINMFIVRMLFLLGISLIGICIAIYAKNSISLFVIVLGFVVMPTFFYYKVPSLINAILPTLGYNGKELYTYSEKVLGVRFDIATIISIIIIATVSLILINRKKR